MRKRTFLCSLRHLVVMSLAAMTLLGCASVSTPNVSSALQLTTTSLPGATVGKSYQATLIVVGGTAPYQWKVSSGNLPNGLSVDASTSNTSAISGSPTSAGTANFTITVQDSAQHSASASLSIVVATAPQTLAISTTSLSSGMVGSAYSATLTATGGTPPYQWSISSGSLPAGLSLNASTGAISGTPSDSGTAKFAATVQDSAQQSASANLSIVISAASSTLAVTTTSLSSGTVASAYSTSLTASGGTPPYQWSISSGTLPAGLSLNASTGIISGTPSSAGTSNFTATVQDSAQHSASASLSLSIAAAPPTLAITTTSLSSGTISLPYSTTITATGGTPPYQWSVSSGSLPAGLSLNASTGVISGTPSTSGTFNFTATVQDSAQHSASASLSIAVAAVSTTLTITTSSLSSGTVGSPYSATITATGGTPPYQWSISSGTLPGGLSLNASTGVISGTPSTSGTFNFTATVQDSAQHSASASLSLSIAAAPPTLAITTTSLSSGTAGSPYSATLTATGGSPPYQWSISSGTLPGGLSLNASTGVISGTPSASGTANFKVTVQDSATHSASSSLSISVAAAPPALAITTASLPSGTVGTNYATPITATGGAPPYQWSISSGSLPAGLALNASTGVISGIPSSSGVANFKITVEDSAQHSASASLSISIAAGPPTLTITTSSLPSGTVGSVYSTTLAATGGTPSYQWSISTGSLPAGLSLNASTGIISGTPSASGTANFTATVQDSAQHSASANLSILIAAASQTLTITTTSLPSGTVGSVYSTTLAATGGTPPYQWSITSGSLPAGLSLNASTGIISGTPSASGTASLKVSVQDAGAHSASANLSITISASGPPPNSVVVTSYGATGNGTTDDTNAINAAIAALQSGQTLYFPCGTYLISNALSPLSLSNIQVLGPSSQCATLHVNSSNNFNAFVIQGSQGSSANLAADVTSNTFTLVSGGASSLGLSVGDYVMISDAAVNDNGSGSPPIATQEVVKVAAIDGDTVTIEGTFAWMFTMVSAEPAQWGSNPYATKFNAVSNVIVKYLTIDGTGSTGTIYPLRLDVCVGSEVGYVNISNFTSNADTFYGFNPDMGYQNNFHDMTLTNAANGPLDAEGNAVLMQRQSYLTVNNVSVVASAGQGVFGFGYHDGYWGTLSNININLNGATGRVFKTLRADHNTFNSIVAMNGVGHNGINITDVSQYNTFNNCVSTGNDQHGIDMFGSYDIGNTFNNCTSKFNAGRQFNFSAGYSGQYADDNTTINGGTLCCARGGGAIIQQNGNGFTLSNASVYDDQGSASAGLEINGQNCSVTNNTFSGLPAGQDIVIQSQTGCTFSGNTVPDGTTPSGLAKLLAKPEILYAFLIVEPLPNR